MGNARVQGFADSHLSFPLQLGTGGGIHDAANKGFIIVAVCVCKILKIFCIMHFYILTAAGIDACHIIQMPIYW